MATHNVLTATPSGGSVHEVDPISRIEGHLGVKVVTDASGKIIDANAHGNLWRGFENFLLGRDVNDAITFTQRICGVCPVPHGMTSTYAVDNVLGYSKGHITFATNALPVDGFGVTKKAVLIRNMVLGAEFLMSSITHFYHLVAPSYVQGPAIPPWTPYFDNSYYTPSLRSNGAALPKVVNTPSAPQSLWDAVIFSYVKALKIRRMTFEAGALFAGRMPMTSCYVGGGVTTDGTKDLTDLANRYKTIMLDVAAFVIAEYIPIALVLGALYLDNDNGTNSLDQINAPFGKSFGAGLGRFLAWGGFPGVDVSGTLLLPGGVKGSTSDFVAHNKQDVYDMFLTGGTHSVPANLTEDITNSRYSIASGDASVYTASSNGSNPFPGDVSRTRPSRTNGYTYMKAPRWGTRGRGQACEVGPLARMAVAGYYPTNGVNIVANGIGGYANALYGVSGNVLANGLDLAVIDSNIINGLKNTTAAGVVSYQTSIQTNSLAYIGKRFIEGLTTGLSTMDRLRARALESAVICVGILGQPTKNWATSAITWDNTGWCGQLLAVTGGANDTARSTWISKTVPTGTKSGWGGTEAPRGALMHQCTIQNGKITKYQCIVPTTWNGSPKDATGNRGAIEQAMINAVYAGTPDSFVNQAGVTKTTAGGVEVLRIAQSFDPCIACAIH